MRKNLYLLFVVLIGFILILGIYQKEILLSSGTSFYLELAPVDPRSLMQGDYMSLNYKANTRLNEAETQSSCAAYHSKAVLTLDGDRVASFARFYKKGEAVAGGEIKVNIVRIRRAGIFGWQSASVAPSGFMFQEGLASKYQNAKYAILKADKSGSVLLTALADENRKEIK